MHGHVAWLSIVMLGALAGCSAHTANPPDRDAGARIYGGSCIACHQQDGRGIPGVYPSLVGSPVLLGDPKELAAWVIEGRRPPAMPAGRYPTMMLKFSWMNDQDAAALLTYVRSHFGNTALPVDAATIAQALGR